MMTLFERVALFLAIIVFSILSIIADGLNNCARAEQVQLNVTGNIVAAPCMTNDITRNVLLGSMVSRDSVGAVGNMVDFAITISGCSAGTTKVIVEYSGTSPVAAPNDLFSNQYAGADAATGVFLQLMTRNATSNGTVERDGVTACPKSGVYCNLASGKKTTVNVTGGMATLEYSARLNSQWALVNATSGKFQSAVTFTLSYQ